MGLKGFLYMARFRTTVIGSLPEFEHNRLEDKIKAAVDFQVDVGIDIVSDGEQRSDMITYMASDLPGLKVVNGKARISGPIRAPDDLEEVGKVRDVIIAKDYINERGYNVGLKVSVTGPVTLGFACALAGLGPYKSLTDEQLYHDLSVSLRTILERLTKEDVMIQLDEPGLSAGFLRPSIAIPHIERALEGINPRSTSLHVCGKLRGELFDHLLSLKGVTALSLEFGGATENINLLEGLALRAGKLIGVGCVKVRALNTEEVDSVERVVNVLRQVVNKIGPQRVKFVHPDCGLRNLNRNVAWKILNNLVEANKSFQG
jgi:5-methyltetrahydropteroyltriglutamate--homocysteine methyltransferase